MRLELVVVVLTGCVSIPEGRFSCELAADCPSGWVCRPERRCYRAQLEGDAGDGDVVDAQLEGDVDAQLDGGDVVDAQLEHDAGDVVDAGPRRDATMCGMVDDPCCDGLCFPPLVCSSGWCAL